MNWISIDERLPEDGQEVLFLYDEDLTWEPYDQTNEYSFEVKIGYFCKGITKAEKHAMKNGDIPTTYVGLNQDIPRWRVHFRGDEDGNNRVPYAFETVWGGSVFGQCVRFWQPIPDYKHLASKANKE